MKNIFLCALLFSTVISYAQPVEKIVVNGSTIKKLAKGECPGDLNSFSSAERCSDQCLYYFNKLKSTKKSSVKNESWGCSLNTNKKWSCELNTPECVTKIVNLSSNKEIGVKRIACPKSKDLFFASAANCAERCQNLFNGVTANNPKHGDDWNCEKSGKVWACSISTDTCEVTIKSRRTSSDIAAEKIIEAEQKKNAPARDATNVKLPAVPNVKKTN